MKAHIRLEMGDSMKRVFSVVCVVLLLLGLTACAPDKNMPTSTTVQITVSTTAPITSTTDTAGVLHENVHLVGKIATDFELPLNGATGFASYPIEVYSTDDGTTVVRTLQAGDAFTVIEEQGTRWFVALEDGVKGFVEYKTCYLNIPDVIPSAVIAYTNSTASVFASSGVHIPTITGEKLYESCYYNPRFEEDKHIVAANYAMVKKIYAAQKAALAKGYTLVINETFRPMDVQLNISAQLAKLRESNPTVRENIDKSPWGIGWFIANRPSTHQMGCAMDVSLAKVETMTRKVCGEYLYEVVTAYSSCEMPSPIHELSVAAVSLEKPVNSMSKTAWKTINPASSMTQHALLLRQFCVDAGLSPLASEWWHFNDLDVKENIKDRYVTDTFYLDTCLSQLPN